jgi:hypothetical protein
MPRYHTPFDDIKFQSMQNILVLHTLLENNSRSKLKIHESRKCSHSVLTGHPDILKASQDVCGQNKNIFTRNIDLENIIILKLDLEIKIESKNNWI